MWFCPVYARFGLPSLLHSCKRETFGEVPKSFYRCFDAYSSRSWGSMNLDWGSWRCFCVTCQASTKAYWAESIFEANWTARESHTADSPRKERSSDLTYRNWKNRSRVFARLKHVASWKARRARHKSSVHHSFAGFESWYTWTIRVVVQQSGH